MSSYSVASIDLSAVRHNFKRVKQAASQAKTVVVVKANAYGHGMLEISQALSEADGYAVARLDEAIALRDSGIKKTILILTGFHSVEEAQACAEYDLAAVLHNDEQLDCLNKTRLSRPISIWLKINTGMNRLGIDVGSLAHFSRELTLSENICQPVKLMTHLACADDMSNAATEDQIAVFDKAIKGLSEQNPIGEQSIANSAGLLGWSSVQRDWVRPGIMLYGGNPFCDKTAADVELEPVMTLRSKVIALRTIQKGQSVGYGASWTATKTCRIATLGIGYGDGYPRHAKTGTPVLISGQRVPLVGRVSMDSINVDVTELDSVEVMDEAILWGKGLPIDEIANSSSTISYDLMCGVTDRVPRVYAE
ncbi:MAG: alanine racemase [Cycloclasticus sp. symbiont of Poecilosclerida sp. M]|nr:MAG: alanine racemase [Cycloclasticus sp. symbiont of Poecilosclerida sp. M]